jgi:hypothetical protein
VRVNSTGNLPSAFGRQISARKVTPSRIFKDMSRSMVTSLLSAALVPADAKTVRARKQKAMTTLERIFTRSADITLLIPSAFVG